MQLLGIATAGGGKGLLWLFSRRPARRLFRVVVVGGMRMGRDTAVPRGSARGIEKRGRVVVLDRAYG
jgi:hypothetical protein